MVQRRLVGLVEKGAGDVANAYTEPDHTGYDHFLGLPTCVGGDERQAYDKGCLVGACKVTVALENRLVDSSENMGVCGV